MPILKEFEIEFDPDAVKKPLVVVGTKRAVPYWEKGQHAHRKPSFLLNLRGMITCEADDGVWVVPPHSALWIPAGKVHSSRMSGNIECYVVFLDPGLITRQPRSCATLSASPLLRELVLRSAEAPADAPFFDADFRILAVLLDELDAAQDVKLSLPMPKSAALRNLADMLLRQPADRATLTQWAARIGLSERTLSRSLLNETGMSFGQWRHQLHVVLALQRLGDGETVQNVAIDLGYESASSFVTMFRKTVGKPPARYLMDQTSSHSEGRTS
ncbi:MAG: helix-turn-helix transcriptional regulator [Agrobacterium cavarae]|uniref:AraC family transcriptional regulator n=1 Tax=Agrobacterium cavarae TaxID=2528239 RepID=UPI0031A3E58D